MRFSQDNPRCRYERPGWVDYRMELFQKYCLPSVLAQTDDNFDWWFVVNPGFPGLARRHIEVLTKYGKLLEITAPWEEKQPEIGHALSGRYNNEWVCSTRLDSDDMLHKDFMTQLKAHATKGEQFISFSMGYMVKDGKAHIRRYEVNPFMSYVEYANPLRTVYHEPHIKANKRGIPFNLIEFPGWAQVDHGDNIKNRVHERIKNFEANAEPLSRLEGFKCT